MSFNDVRDLVQVNDVKDIKIVKFSSANSDDNAHSYFAPKTKRESQIFSVFVYPRGLSSEFKDYVSVQLCRVGNDFDPSSKTDIDSASWTLCIVDVNGCGRYYQSFSKDNVKYFPYYIDIVHFIKRSVLLDQAEELLPDDALTVRCELSYMFHELPNNNGYELFLHVLDNEESDITKKMVNDGPLEIVKKQTKTNWLFHGAELVIPYIIEMLSFLVVGVKCSYSSSSVEFWEEKLNSRDARDEIRRTYLSRNPIFITYNRIKTKVRKSLADTASLKNVVMKEDVFEKITSLSEAAKTQQLMDMWGLKFSHSGEREDSKFVTALMLPSRDKKVIQENKLLIENPFFSEPKIDEMKDGRNYIKEAIDCIFSVEEEQEIDSDNNGEWSFTIETMDGAVFDIPFGNGKETLGSKLVSSSRVYERMLINPMLEKFQMKVKLYDVDFETFLEFLYFLQKRNIETTSIFILCSLYEMADEYEVL
ncbi:uncharacterized protein NPIL_308571 [Nephila pilipes]|uniref:MATH domain-containing protein n=1 Tax=Nephila pilipes TaxID=299642 RepID=A0A8X6PEB6_NEPPI|nr:uncharacterized protein NPIL_308571 [Nephila pilipes]